MIHEETFHVTQANGVRPGGKQDRCFYCQQPLGTPHKDDCVCRSKTVMLDVRVRLVRSVPASWSSGNILFHCNESGSCCNNILDDIDALSERLDAHEWCMCPHIEVTGVRDATAEDESDQLWSEREGE